MMDHPARGIHQQHATANLRVGPALARSASVLSAVLLVCGLAACNQGRRAHTTIISAEEYRIAGVRDDTMLPAEYSPAPRSTTASPDAAAAPVPLNRTGPIAAAEGVGPVRATPGQPAAAPPDAGVPIEDGVLVDAKVGDINGRPVYVRTFLEPMSQRLEAQAAVLTRADWRTFARREIRRSLDLFIEDELLRAEALSSLTPEQQQGFFNFMQGLQKRVQSEQGGTRTAASERLYRETGQTLDSYLQTEEERQLIQFELARKIGNRANVSWREIVIAYEQNPQVFNPPPRARFRYIRVPKDRPADIEAVTARIAAGESWEEIGKGPQNRNRPRDGGLEVIEIKESREKTEFFANPKLNEAARTVPVSGVVGPIDLEDAVAWVHLEQIEDLRIPLYEAQLRIENALRRMRTEEEKAKYLARLKSRASMTSSEQMVAQLVSIAETRHYPPSRSEPARPQPLRAEEARPLFSR